MEHGRVLQFFSSSAPVQMSPEVACPVVGWWAGDGRRQRASDLRVHSSIPQLLNAPMLLSVPVPPSTLPRKICSRRQHAEQRCGWLTASGRALCMHSPVLSAAFARVRQFSRAFVCVSAWTIETASCRSSAGPTRAQRWLGTADLGPWRSHCGARVGAYRRARRAGCSGQGLREACEGR